MRKNLFVVFLFVIAVLFVERPLLAEEKASPVHADVVIYGGTPSGIAAAISAAREDKSVLLIEPYSRIGGLATNGLSHPDFRTFEAMNGVFLELTQNAQKYYAQKYGEGNPEGDSFRGTHAEPHVNLLIFQQMLAKHEKIRVLLKHRLKSVDASDSEEARRIISIVVEGDQQQLITVSGKIFIDASYEGDLLAAAGVEYHVGRESREKYGESLAPEQEDAEVQGYNFRLIMTQEPSNKVLAFRPENYQREDYLPLLELFEKEKIQTVFCAPTGGIYKYQPPRLPGNKYDINDVSRGVVRLSIPQISKDWPDGDQATRVELYKKHVQHQVGMLYFLQTDEAVPEKIQEEANSWGFCRDEFAAHQHIPEQLYVREARRMIGKYVFTENDTAYAPEDARSVHHQTAIAIGDYGHNCHGTNHEGDFLGGKHTGEFYKSVPPYQIPYEALLPKNCKNLIVPVACSSSHVGFCALRLEPIWTSLGQAAGIAAALAVDADERVEEVSAREIQKRLHRVGAATVYFSDILPGHEDFEAVQWWGSLGGFHGLEKTPAKAGQRGERIFGQYFQAYPGHAAKLDEPMSEEVSKLWMELAVNEKLKVPRKRFLTRGDFIRTVFASQGAK